MLFLFSFFFLRNKFFGCGKSQSTKHNIHYNIKCLWIQFLFKKQFGNKTSSKQKERQKGNEPFAARLLLTFSGEHLYHKFFHSSGCGGCAGASLPPKPDDTDAANDGISNDGADTAVGVPKPVPTGADAFATDGGSGGGV